ncbi:MAG: hypothetical protein GOVbin2917_43 [Prokaryotic dsDNA virus sp.]|jgi:hypothetical protein|nr:MAG: hypothetical protein GOVbin2917_43 [Prokaryotic dsDNA virus sp.]|tara:strand:+ start:78685 stop:78957 length:273 start_codon:yes stop_codon:yes gene_type:complete
MFFIKLKKYIPSHKNLRDIAITLNLFCLVEIGVVIFFSWLCYDLLVWYKDITTPENFAQTPFWAAIGSLVAAIFGALKYINHTYEARKDG